MRARTLVTSFGLLALMNHASGNALSSSARASGARQSTLFISKRLGTRFVARRVRAGEPAFVEAWDKRGGKAGDERLIAWLDENREAFVRALSILNP